jgi:hypothetical protein
MTDLTDKDFFANFLGSFWTRIFADKGFTEGIASVSVSEIVQSYQSLVEAVNRLSIDSIRATSSNLFQPIIIRKSQFSTGPDVMKYGNGAVFGPQLAGGALREGVTFAYGGLERRTGNFYTGLEKEVVDIGESITNGLVAPSVTMIRGIDFTFSDGILTFRDDPFLNPLISSRSVFSESSGEDLEIVLWTSSERNNAEFEDQFGFASAGVSLGSPNYFESTRSSLRAISGGPTISLIDHFIASLIGLPCIRSDKETVLSIATFGSWTIVATDLDVYKIDQSLELRDVVVEGTTLELGHPLTTGSVVFNHQENPSWWTAIEGLVLSETFFNIDFKSALGFMNTSSEVTLSSPEQSPDDTEWRSAKFFIAGQEGDVDLFWSKARSFGLSNGLPIGNAIYKYLGVVDENGDADFTKTVILNPLQFIAENVFNSGAIIVKVQSSTALSLENFFRGVGILEKIIPAYLGLIVIIDVSVNDEVFFQRADGQGAEPLEMDLASTRDVFRGSTESFPSDVSGLWTETSDDGEPLTKCPEAISMDWSPDAGKETISFGSSSENALAYGASTKVCVEFIESANIITCKQ